MFDEKLKGIGKPRTIVRQEKTTLEILLENCDEIIDRLTKESVSNEYLEIQNQVLLLEHFSPTDIVALIQYKNYLDFQSKNQEKLFGIYTGTLVNVLDGRNRKIGKETNIIIKDAHFDYLLWGVRNADTITLENCHGYNLLGHAASSGEIKSIILRNCKGYNILEHSATSGCGLVKSTINSITLEDCNGNNILEKSSHGSYATIGSIILKRCNGNYMLNKIGYMSGSIESVTLIDCSGDNMLNEAAYWKGNISSVTMLNCHGNNMLRAAIPWNGNVESVTLEKCSGRDNIPDGRYKIVNNQVISNENFA